MPPTGHPTATSCGEHIRWVVLEPAPLAAWACIRCGDCDLFQAPGEDRSPARDAPAPAPLQVSASSAVLAWVSAFPRLVSLQPDSVGYVPATFRIDDAESASAAVTTTVDAQARLSVLERLRSADLPTAPPPPDLPPRLGYLHDVQEAAAAVDRGDVDELIELTARFFSGRPSTSPVRRVVEEAIAASPAAVGRLVEGLRHPDAGRRREMLVAATALAPVAPALLDPLIELLRDPLDPDPAGDELRHAAAAVAEFEDDLLAPHVDVFEQLAQRARRGSRLRLNRDAKAFSGYLRDTAERLIARTAGDRNARG